jgi:hypothetical protein
MPFPQRNGKFYLKTQYYQITFKNRLIPSQYLNLNYATKILYFFDLQALKTLINNLYGCKRLIITILQNLKKNVKIYFVCNFRLYQSISIYITN